MSYLDRFEKYLSDLDKSDNTIKSYQKIIGKFENWLLEAYDIKDVAIIQSREIKHFREKLLEKQSPSTVNLNLSGIKSFFKFLLEEKIIQSNPAEKIKLQKIVDHNEHQYLSRAEELAVLKKGEEKNLLAYTAIILLVKTGIRISELTDLRLNSIVLENEPMLIVKDSKGKKSRYVPLTKDVVEALKKYLDERNKSTKIYHQRSPYVFISQRASKFTVRGVERILTEIGNSAGIHLYPIRLRSTFAFNMIESGAPLTVVQQLLGHSSLEMVARYGKPSFKNKRDYMEKLSEI